MLKKTDQTLSALPPGPIAVISLLMIAVVGLIDHWTGYELSFSIFYLIPVSFAAWYVRGQLGFIICILSAGTWLYIDLASGHIYDNQAIPFWNTLVRLGFFVIIALLLRKIKSSLELQLSLAQRDGLTKLLNARTFKQSAGEIFDLSARHKHTLAIGFIDLDGFKGVNDKLGHSVGDQVLKDIAETMSKRLRRSDVCGRLGGDEFALLLPETDREGADKFFASLHKSLLDHVAAKGWPVGFSVGVAVFHSFDISVDEAIRLADALMYRVKHSGKNRIIIEEYGDNDNA